MVNFNFSKSELLLAGCLVFLASVLVVSFLPTETVKSDFFWFVGFSVALVLLVLAGLFFESRKHAGFLKIILASLALIFLAGWRYSISIPKVTPNDLQFYSGQSLTIIGKIADDPDVRPSQIRHVFEASYLKELKRPVSGQLLVTNGLYPEYRYGDQLAVSCRLTAPKAIDDFAYDRYLARSEIYSVCYQPKIKLLTAGVARADASYYGRILNFKEALRRLMNLGLVEPEASLARGIILGDQRGLPGNIKNDFARTGLSHIVAISGMNFTFIVLLLSGLLLAVGLRRQQVFYLVSLAIFGYVILIGLPASAVRAVIMSFLFLSALYLGRLAKLTNALILAATIMTMFNPKLLRDDVGFQLSFLALLGIIYVYPLLDAWLATMNFKLPKFLSEAVSLTLAAQVFTLPIMAGSFKAVSLIAPISNLFILWTLPVLTVSLSVGLLIGWWLPNLAIYLFWPSQLILKYIIWAIRQFSSITWAQLPVSQFGWWLTVLYYCFVGWFIFKLRYDKIKTNDYTSQN